MFLKAEALTFNKPILKMIFLIDVLKVETILITIKRKLIFIIILFN